MTTKQVTKSSTQTYYKWLPLLYPLVALFTPDFLSLDSNGPKFFVIALLNLFIFLALWLGGKLREMKWQNFSFITSSRIGLIYSCFVGMSILSISKSINLGESLIMVSKVITGFFAAYLIHMLFTIDKRGIIYLIRGLIILLIFDSISVFYQVSQYITRNISSILEIKTFYSHKNILAASIFIKMAFALWAFVYDEIKWRRYSFIALLFGVIATLMLSTRSFYIGTFLMTIIFSYFLIVQFLRSRERKWINLFFQYLGIVAFSFLLYSGVQNFLYPNTSEELDIYNNDVSSRLATIAAEPGGERIASWKRSLQLFMDEPILGVGIGNWKIRVLELANKTSSDFIYHIKNHNDFIELFVETGIIGGFLYMFIFILVGWKFIQIFYIKKNAQGIKLFLLPILGVFGYALDSFFNFPIDRPEVLLLFSIFLAITIYYSKSNREEKNSNRFNINSKLIGCVLVSLMVGVSYTLFLNFSSLKQQRIVLKDIRSGNLKYSSKDIIDGFPPISTVTHYGEPVAVNKARYLINEKKYEEAISLLRGNVSSPFDSRVEYFMAMAFISMNNYDSANFYLDQALIKKPYFYRTVEMKCDLYEKNGKDSASISLLENYLEKEKDDPIPWLRLASFYEESNLNKAIEVLDSAIVQDFTERKGEIKTYRSNMINRKRIQPYIEIYNEAFRLYDNQDYRNAEKYFTEFISKEKRIMKVYELRAYCFYIQKRYSESIDDINTMSKFQNIDPGMLNLRGICYHFLGDNASACNDFTTAVQRGSQDAISNYNAFCKN